MILLAIIILGITYLLWSRSLKNTENKVDKITGETSVIEADNNEFFNLNNLNQDIVIFADKAYATTDKNNNNPDYYDGIPPFKFFKRIDCQIIYADKETEKTIKKYSETVSFHTIVLLKDSRGNLYDFTLTSTVADKSVLRLQHYGPLTNENPNMVNLPIDQRRLKDFPVDFNTNRVLNSNDGRCVYIPYPIISDQVFWLLGNDLKNSSLQGLYRNDRVKNIDEYFDQMKFFFVKEAYPQ